MKVKIVTAIVAIALLLASCTGKPIVWETDYDTAIAAAQKQNKNLLIFFSGIEWDGLSQMLKADIFDNSKFMAATKNYVFLNVDIPADPESISPEEMEKKYALLGRYPITNTPTIVLSDKDGTAFDIITNNSEMTDATEYVKKVNEQAKAQKKRGDLRKKIASAAGIKKVKLIDDLFEATPMEFRDSLMEFVSEVPTLDPNNETGLLGKYELQLVYPQAIAMLSMGDPLGGAQLFLDYTKTAHGSAEDLQQAYYMAAYFNAAANTPMEEVVPLLQKALDSAPESEMAAGILQTIEQLNSAPAEDTENTEEPKAPDNK